MVQSGNFLGWLESIHTSGKTEKGSSHRLRKLAQILAVFFVATQTSYIKIFLFTS